ncbi:unnamed protein product [Hyaloperonospora brassicae]|uniref:WRC domain-containing protein n=1 Tax=Hyaloperonospora brassicae TaxID=162125 RepID=A0AAV0TEK4_HYABA|nr:unnamed protein product [Hyaloperonospora brassicae]
MVITTTYSSSELLSSFAQHAAGNSARPTMLQPPLPPLHASHVTLLHHPCALLDTPSPPVSHVLPHLTLPGHSVMGLDAPHKRSPLLCGYPSKKCWSWRVEKRNGELHKFCEYHRQKANTNQRRMEQRRKQGRPASPRAKPHVSGRRSPKVSAAIKLETVLHVGLDPVMVTKWGARAGAGAAMSASSLSPAATATGSPRGIDGFDDGSSAEDDVAMLSWMDAELDVGMGMDAAVEYMMADAPVIDVEPSDTPVDLFEEDLFFLEHFIDEISHSAV